MRYFTTSQVAKILGMKRTSGSRIRRLILDGRIAARKVGKMYLVDEYEIKRFVNRDRDRRRKR